MPRIHESLTTILALPGALCALIGEYHNQLILGYAGDKKEVERIVVQRENLSVMAKALFSQEVRQRGDDPEDFLITQKDCYHIFRPVSDNSIEDSVFVYLMLERKEANLALVRHRLSDIASTLEL